MCFTFSMNIFCLNKTSCASRTFPNDVSTMTLAIRRYRRWYWSRSWFRWQTLRIIFRSFDTTVVRCTSVRTFPISTTTLTEFFDYICRMQLRWRRWLISTSLIDIRLCKKYTDWYGKKYENWFEHFLSNEFVSPLSRCFILRMSRISLTSFLKYQDNIFTSIWLTKRFKRNVWMSTSLNRLTLSRD